MTAPSTEPPPSGGTLGPDLAVPAFPSAAESAVMDDLLRQASRLSAVIFWAFTVAALAVVAAVVLS